MIFTESHGQRPDNVLPVNASPPKPLIVFFPYVSLVVCLSLPQKDDREIREATKQNPTQTFHIQWEQQQAMNTEKNRNTSLEQTAAEATRTRGGVNMF